MQRHITIAIAVTTMSLFALMLWQTGTDATGKDTAVAGGQLKPEYAVTPDPYLPIKRLGPIW
jgi:hypothetical protein